MFEFHRVFCATPWEMEGERIRFQEMIAAFNEENAMRQGILFVPVSLVNIRDKRPLQYDIDENIRACGYYVLLAGDDWGPPERNFENDYKLAVACAEDPTLPMRQAVIVRNAAKVFDESLQNLLCGWLSDLVRERQHAS